MIKQQFGNDIKCKEPLAQNNKKWCQLKKNEQICISNILRNQYIDFVLGKDRKPNKNEKEFITACAYLEILENQIYISVPDLRKYFQSRIPKYDISIEKF
ncbi:hypothetical protein [Clostridium estertheticum]|uniref:Uncharacterized protein n=1 Tax=Clostridium estertheticum TaxID=238834 RepID=A0AA47EK77_9CLOT|nr:hypothetical protein [Clostridium estertheticum]MBU3154668.1 hypothetical protein [Clostridium estertheticum]WAG61753.1 hypothetical protein LL038_05765 [Clostridium estertheticum]